MKIAINLLPIEFRAQELKSAKFYKIQTVGILTILLMIFLASLTITLRILQGQKISQIKQQLTLSEQKITSLKDTQASLFLLKNRLGTISQYLDLPSNQSQMYQLITKLLPESVSLSSISIDKSGGVLLSAIASDGNALDDLITNLTSKETNQDKISQVSVESVNRGRDGIYRISLKIKSKST